MGTVFQKLKIYSQEREFSRNGNCSVAEIAVVTKIFKNTENIFYKKGLRNIAVLLKLL